MHRLRASTTSAQPPSLDDWISEQSSRSIVYATLGTIFGGNIPVLRAMLDGPTSDGVPGRLTAHVQAEMAGGMALDDAVGLIQRSLDAGG